MKTYQIYFDKAKPNKGKIAICLGYFDGVHQAHKEIIKKAVTNSSLPIALLTFDKPVSTFLNNQKSKEVLTSLDDRFRIINRLGVDYFYVLHIDENFLKKEAMDFISFLKELNVDEIYVGEDYRFGYKRIGDIALLKKYFKVFSSPLLKIDGNKISTQEIIKLIKEGNIEKANILLGQNYLISGVVEHGLHNGEKIGFKTANVKLSSNYLIPRFGVYKVIAYIDGIAHLAIANVGLHPSIKISDKPLIEVHIPNFDEDIYNHSISVEFLKFIRPEIKFKSIDELIKQINKDVSSLNAKSSSH